MTETTITEMEPDEAEETEIIRAKWIMDEATTLPEAAAKVRAFADELDRMHAEGVKRVVVAEGVLESRSAPVATDTASDADHQRADRADEA